MSKARKTRSFRRAGRGSVLLIALLLITSGVLRISSTVAVAANTDAQVAPKPLPNGVDPKPMTTDAARMAGGAPDKAEMGSLLEALNAREARVKERERQIEMRSKALSVADAEIAKRLAMLEEAEAALRGTLSLANGAAEDDLARLTTVYESMKPKDTAALFETMEPDFAAGFLGRMRPDAAAAVMTGLSPEVAYSISAILAGRNARVPKN
jgi:flagellar motility protein MotE (MotC chaperone)